MIWASWRQQRTETVIAALLLLLAAALLVPTGLHMASIYDRDGIAACLAHPTSDCRQTLELFTSRWDSLLNLVGWFNLLPGLVGVLFAVPLVLEFEHGTHRLAWTQSVTRDRWLATRLGLIVAATVVTMAAFSVAMDLVASAARRRRRAPAGWLRLRGNRPDRSCTLRCRLRARRRRGASTRGGGDRPRARRVRRLRIGIEGWARQHYRAPLHATWTGSAEPDLHTAWVLSQTRELRLTGGGAIDPATASSCLSGGKLLEGTCLARNGIVEYAHAVYQPASRVWLFQGIEAGIFLALAVALGAFAVVWIRRRVS